jgi:Cu-Zn family superoxide dismutase
MARRLVPALLAAAAAAACSSAGGNAPPSSAPVPGQRAGQRSPVAAPPTFETRNVAPARAELRDADGRVVGAATFTQVAHGVVVVAELTGLPAGTHAMHVHDVGRCEPPFTTAGAHFNPGARLHGVKNRNGYHAGDLPNFTAPATGTARVDAVRPRRFVDHGAQRVRRLRERPGRQRRDAHRVRRDHPRDAGAVGAVAAEASSADPRFVPGPPTLVVGGPVACRHRPCPAPLPRATRPTARATRHDRTTTPRAHAQEITWHARPTP